MTSRPGADSTFAVSPSLAARLAALSPEKRALVEAQLRAARSTEAPSAPTRRPAGQPAPLSFAQELLWLIQLADPATSAYNVPRALRLRGRIDGIALQAALDTIVERHEILRTRIVAGENGFEQRVARAEPVALETLDLCALRDDVREAELESALIARARRPFDLGRDQLLHATLARVADEEYVLLLVMHHVASDGASREILYRELAAHYAAARHGSRAELASPTIQYGDWAAWQRERLAGAELERLLGWWRAHLDGAPRRLELPTDRPARATPTFDGARRHTRLGRAVHSAVVALAERERVTPFVVLLTATQVLLARHARQTDVVVGSVLSGRSQPELEGLLGLFSAMLPLRARFGDDPTFREAIARSRATTLDALEHADLPFEKLALELNPGGSDHAPLAQATVSMLDDGPTVPALEGTTAEPMLLDRGIAKFDLSFAFGLESDDLLAVAEYRTDLFAPATIDAMLHQLGALLCAAAREPEQRISRLPLFDASSRREVLDRWNPPAPAGPLPATTLHDWIVETARSRRDEIAIECEGRTLRYGELLDRSALVATRLSHLGVKAGDRVGVFMERDCELPVALLAVLRAGAAYVPVDPAYPAMRTAMMFEDAGIAAVLTDAASAAALPGTSAPVLHVDPDDAGTGADVPPLADTRADAVRAESLAYVLFTSGSTGRPKGVMVPHRALVNFLASMAREPGLSERDATVAVTTVSFDIAGLELWLPLAVGARVVMAPRRVATDGGALAALIERARESALARDARLLMQATPATWHMLVDAGWGAAGARGVVALCGGEAWPAGLADSLLSRCDELWNVYGPTETTIWSTLARVREPGTPSLGEPLRDTRLYVLEPGGEPAALGVPGELLIGGAGVALGYLGRADLTAERFVVDPFPTGLTSDEGATSPWRTMYRTGDLVRRRANGRLEFLGRLDAQVKVRGHRIELEDVEAALASHAAVRQVAAAVHGSGDDARLVAHVVTTSGVDDASTLAGELRSHAAQRLPAYMVPTIAWLDSLPLTPNGKVDRRALPAPIAEAARTTVYVEPRTDTERAMATLWRETLKVERVGVDDRFVELGGHSLLALRMLGRARAALGATLPLADLLRGATLGELSALMDAARADGAEEEEDEDVPLVPVARDAFRRGAPAGGVGA